MAFMDESKSRVRLSPNPGKNSSKAASSVLFLSQKNRLLVRKTECREEIESVYRVYKTKFTQNLPHCNKIGKIGVNILQNVDGEAEFTPR